MNKRSILYGYQIQNGVLEIVAEEQAVVQQVFERYHAGGFLPKHFGGTEPGRNTIQLGSPTLE